MSALQDAVLATLAATKEAEKRGDKVEAHRLLSIYVDLDDLHMGQVKLASTYKKPISDADLLKELQVGMANARHNDKVSFRHSFLFKHAKQFSKIDVELIKDSLKLKEGIQTHINRIIKHGLFINAHGTVVDSSKTLSDLKAFIEQATIRKERTSAINYVCLVYADYLQSFNNDLLVLTQLGLKKGKNSYLGSITVNRRVAQYIKKHNISL